MDTKLYKYKIKLKLIDIFILKYIIGLFLLNLIFNNIFPENIDINSDINKIEKYYELCNNQTLINNKTFTEILNPKISIICPIFNKENFISRFLKSIKNQFFEEIEIIFIDDKSQDKSVEIIKNFQKEDKRIILIQNKKQKGTLISRNQGVLKSKGEYLMFVDPDDILSSDILKYVYNKASKFNYEFIRFNIYKGNNTLDLEKIVNSLKEGPTYKPLINLFINYVNEKHYLIDFYITNKLIKRNLFIKALININNFFLNQFMIDCEDGLINFMLYKVSNSLFFTKKIGYYYIKQNTSITKSQNFITRIRSNFLYLYYLFLNTKNNKFEKSFTNFYFLFIYHLHKKEINKIFGKTINDGKFYLEVIKSYLHCDFISLKVKRILNNLKSKIILNSVI